MKTYEGLPILSIADTQEIFLAMKDGKWENPAPTKEHGVRDVDSIFIEWIYFFEQAKEGYSHAQRAQLENVFGGGLSEIQSYYAMEEALQAEEVEFPAIITTMENAVAQLLSSEGKKLLKQQNIETKPVEVDEKLRDQFKALVWNMVPIMDAATS
jgi:hypothetical protein